ncbi:MAG: hypothetical protein RMK73_05180 [Geminicoccaceae bacterium]|nr:hypothetical protein [Geminicoccaceae bacterium]MCS7268479.1 hypothetical protein [Geminicoccaceae bacterium]MDW8124369.1 hypothetical protein [Geminicoccaceae bacterium]MDW8340859.1 hypothetical protein [Geminicoccaceae bacterium]
MSDTRFARLLAVALVALTLFNFPMIEVIERWSELSGVALVPVYFFGAWAGVIALAAWLLERESGGEP